MAVSSSVLPADVVAEVVVVDDSSDEGAGPCPSASAIASPLQCWVQRLGHRMVQAVADIIGAFPKQARLGAVEYILGAQWRSWSVAVKLALSR